MSHLRTADAEDLEYILGLREHVERWLAEEGEEQYQKAHFARSSRKHIHQLVQDGRFVILEDETENRLAVGALVPPDLDFWTETDELHTAWYVGRLMTNHHGRDYGGQLLDLLAQAAAHDGRKYLRLDCWRTNTGLHAYYRNHGFQHIRTVDAAHRLSGALFQREVPHQLPSAWDA
jgi:GNAT superfamily N-acetyltransferase